MPKKDARFPEIASAFDRCFLAALAGLIARAPGIDYSDPKAAGVVEQMIKQAEIIAARAAEGR